MRFVHPNCPTCDNRAVSMLGTVLTAMPVETDSVNGEPGYEYGVSSEIAWETEEPLESHLHEVQLTCTKRHTWWTLLEEEEP
jgi:hypothetical protein